MNSRLFRRLLAPSVFVLAARSGIGVINSPNFGQSQQFSENNFFNQSCSDSNNDDETQEQEKTKNESQKSSLFLDIDSYFPKLIDEDEEEIATTDENGNVVGVTTKGSKVNKKFSDEILAKVLKIHCMKSPTNRLRPWQHKAQSRSTGYLYIHFYFLFFIFIFIYFFFGVCKNILSSVLKFNLRDKICKT